MAKIQNQKIKTEQAPNVQDKKIEKTKMSNFLFGLLAFLVATFIMAAVFGGALYLIIHNNINGFAERYRDNIKNIPLLRMALPVPPDPEDPKYLSDEEIIRKYQELRATRDTLARQLEEANKKIAELQKYKDNFESLQAEIDKQSKELDARKLQLDEQEKQLSEDKRQVDELVAKGDRDGFKEFFEKIDKDTAQRLYSEIMKEEALNQEAKKFAQMYEQMDPSAAARIFEEMGASKLELVVDILRYMKKDSYALVVEAMNSEFAAKVTEKMAGLYLPGKG